MGLETLVHTTILTNLDVSAVATSLEGVDQSRSTISLADRSQVSAICCMYHLLDALCESSLLIPFQYPATHLGMGCRLSIMYLEIAMTDLDPCNDSTTRVDEAPLPMSYRCSNAPPAMSAVDHLHSIPMQCLVSKNTASTGSSIFIPVIISTSCRHFP